MDKQEIKDKVINLTADIFHKEKDEISTDTSFVKDLHAKSIDVIALIAALEGEFQLSIPPSDVKKNNTVGKAIDWLDQKLNK